jgi:hypothetical protein
MILLVFVLNVDILTKFYVFRRFAFLPYDLNDFGT